MGCRVEGSGFRIYGLKCGVWLSSPRVEGVWGFEFRVWDLGVRVWVQSKVTGVPYT